MKPSKERWRRFLGHADKKAESRETPSADVITAFRYMDILCYLRPRLTRVASIRRAYFSY